MILVHRLLENRVADEIGHSGYAFYTDAVVAVMGADPAALRMRRHAEQVEDIGPTDGARPGSRRIRLATPRSVSLTWSTRSANAF